MSKRSKRTPGLETAHPFAGLRPVNPHAAGVDTSTSSVQVLAQPKSSPVCLAMRPRN